MDVLGAIGSSRSLEALRLSRSAARLRPACVHNFALHLKQAGFDRAGTTKSPQEICQPTSELKLDHRSRTNTADEGTLERSVGSNVFESLDDGLVSKPGTPSAAT